MSYLTDDDRRALDIQRAEWQTRDAVRAAADDTQALLARLVEEVSGMRQELRELLGKLTDRAGNP
jgi:hypothetical protein